MEAAALGRSPAPLRITIASGLLWLAVVLPVIGTVWLGSVSTNDFAAALQFAFVLVMAPEAAIELKHAWSFRVMRIAAFASMLCMASWHFFQGPFLAIPRSSDYLVLILFAAAAVGWFRQVKDTGFEWVFRAKAVALVVAMVWIGLTWWLLDDTADGQRIFRHTPIYRHVRHLSYDLFAVTALAIYFSSVAPTKTRWQFALLFLALGYLTTWSAGRGGMLALAVFVAVLVASSKREFWGGRNLLPFGFFLLGCLLTTLDGNADRLAMRVDQTLSGSVNHISSGRIGIWTGSLERLMQSTPAVFFGYGPDALLRLGIPANLPGNGGIVQPHSAIIQWLLEFGVVGTLAIVGVLATSCRQALGVLAGNSELSSQKTAAALLLALLVYALVDGIFYHAIPLTLVVLTCAYLAAQQGRRR
ncbi:O-antigen ligase family protein [Sinimarinibacterium sp. CAU 1509]|uniref:O-antigen ligase family protein n=1 Tax=Sinimarinibacterium sp. CAU 1509 TaxID=2562283 RepID=UPI001B7FE7C5|nr:O-antigen ligase family protein [Sinimarinibacterium sp. CAU 1509]